MLKYSLPQIGSIPCRYLMQESQSPSQGNNRGTCFNDFPYLGELGSMQHNDALIWATCPEALLRPSKLLQRKSTLPTRFTKYMNLRQKRDFACWRSLSQLFSSSPSSPMRQTVHTNITGSGDSVRQREYSANITLQLAWL
jgi:hypothetical protein